jgi:hypothetical protein
MELNRFKQLLESTMGDVKPLVNETDKEKVIRGILQGRQPKPRYSDFSADYENSFSDPEYGDSDEDISYDIKSVECDGNEMDGHVDIDEDDTIVIRYCKGDNESLEYLISKCKKLLYSNHGL